MQRRVSKDIRNAIKRIEALKRLFAASDISLHESRGMLITSILALEAGRAMTLLVVRNALPLLVLFMERFFLPSTSSHITLEAVVSLAVLASTCHSCTLQHYTMMSGHPCSRPLCCVVSLPFAYLSLRSQASTALSLSRSTLAGFNSKDPRMASLGQRSLRAQSS